MVSSLQVMSSIDNNWTKLLPEDWDISIMTILAMILGLVWMIRRAAHQHNERRRQQAEMNAAVAAALNNQDPAGAQPGAPDDL